MNVLTLGQPVPVHSLEEDPILSGKLFSMAWLEGVLTYPSELLIPHRKDYYLLVWVRKGTGRHWVDMRPYVTQDNAFYFFSPHQLLVKEEPQPFWATALAFTNEFLALQENAALGKLPLIQNPQGAHELKLAEADVSFVEDALGKLYAEYQNPGEWQQRLLTAHLTVLLTYLSRLYTEQFNVNSFSADQLLLKRYQAQIDEFFRERHQVGEYASLLHVSAGHLSEVVKAQSGKPAMVHIHDRLVLEARRLLFHTPLSLKEIAFELGFSDASYFNRFFKRETGVTPAEYRVVVREMYQ